MLLPHRFPDVDVVEDPTALPTTTPPVQTPKDDEGDYVYDIFYQRLTRDPDATLGNVGTL